MFGQDWENVLQANQGFPQKKGYQHTYIPDNIEKDSFKVGIIPRVINSLMKTNEESIFSDKPNSMHIYVSFLQIYNEKIFDLLQDKLVGLEIHETK